MAYSASAISIVGYLAPFASTPFTFLSTYATLSQLVILSNSYILVKNWVSHNSYNFYIYCPIIVYKYCNGKNCTQFQLPQSFYILRMFTVHRLKYSHGKVLMAGLLQRPLVGHGNILMGAHVWCTVTRVSGEKGKTVPLF